MKSLHSTNHFSKKFTFLAFLAGSLMFSSTVFSKPSCDALNKESKRAWNAYMAMEMICDGVPGVQDICFDSIMAKYKTWTIANAAWKTCEAS